MFTVFLPSKVKILRGVTCVKNRLLYRCCGSNSSGSAEYKRDRTPQRKSREFYVENATARNYFYLIDTRGQLFLEETEGSRNMATCLKDKNFLAFFYSQLRVNSTGTFADEYPYVSMCGRERNFVCPQDPMSAFVFAELSMDGTVLFYGGATSASSVATAGSGSTSDVQLGPGRVAFDPAALVYHTETGRLYHPISGHRHLGRDAKSKVRVSGSDGAPGSELGLLHPHLCQRLCAGITFRETLQNGGSSGASADTDANGCWVISFRGREYELGVLGE